MQTIMREILFRAKRTDNGEWVEGFYCKGNETTYAFEEDYERNPVPIHHYIMQDQMTDWGLPNKIMLIEVDPSTICQYTGIMDKNGKKIWEGDILSRDVFGNVLVGEVVWRDIGNTGFFLKRETSDDFTSLTDIVHYYPIGRGRYDDDEKNICNDVILGNIYDNPDILEREKTGK